MPDRGPASEFGGKRTSRHGVQPAPHIPTPSERLSLLYRTGDESGLVDVDVNGDVFAGLLPEEKQRAIREAEGVMRKGEVFEQMQVEAQSEIADLRTDDV